MIGETKAVEICGHLTKTYGERFNTPDLLREMADKGESFYGRFGKDAKAA